MGIEVVWMGGSRSSGHKRREGKGLPGVHSDRVIFTLASLAVFTLLLSNLGNAPPSAVRFACTLVTESADCNPTCPTSDIRRGGLRW